MAWPWPVADRRSEMAKLSKAQMRMYAAAAGFTNPGVMAEVGWAESGGDTKVVNSIGATGVWQILQPLHVKSHPTWTTAWLQNPLNNARAAKVLYDADRKAGGNGLRPWEDSRLKGNGGGWGNKISGASQADWEPFEDWNDPFDLWDEEKWGPAPESPWESLTGETPPESLEGITDVAKLGVKAAEWMSNPRNWLYVGYVVLGGVVVVTALSATVRTQIIGQAKGLIGKGGSK